MLQAYSKCYKFVAKCYMLVINSCQVLSNYFSAGRQVIKMEIATDVEKKKRRTIKVDKVQILDVEQRMIKSTELKLNVQASYKESFN